MNIDQISLRNNPECPFGNLKWTGYYWENPKTVPDYEEDYWGIVKDPDGNDRNFEDEIERRIEDKKNIYDFLKKVKPGKILDVGCGPGIFLAGLNKDWNCYGNDISRKALEYCTKYAKTVHGTLPHFELKPESFDVISFQHVIEHLEKPIDYFDCIKNILKKHGILILATPDFDSGCARRFKENFRMMHDKGHISLFTSNSLIKLHEDKGFEIIKIEYPFFQTRWFNKENILKMFDNKNTSPPFYGNHIVIYSRKLN